MSRCKNFTKGISQKRKLNVEDRVGWGLNESSRLHRKNCRPVSTKGHQENASFYVGQRGALLLPRILAVWVFATVLNTVLSNLHSISSSMLVSSWPFSWTRIWGWSSRLKWYADANFPVGSGCWTRPWRSWSCYNLHTENWLNYMCQGFLIEVYLFISAVLHARTMLSLKSKEL